MSTMKYEKDINVTKDKNARKNTFLAIFGAKEEDDTAEVER